jgi:hypothetical protein
MECETLSSWILLRGDCLLFPGLRKAQRKLKGVISLEELLSFLELHCFLWDLQGQHINLVFYLLHPQ